MTVKVNPQVHELLRVVATVVDPTGAKYAISGAVAMAAHGYVRNTMDVDLFVDEGDRHRVFSALRKFGYRIGEVVAPSQFFARAPDETDPDVHIDLLIPNDEPEFSAIETAVRMQIEEGGPPLPVAQADFVALSKFIANRVKDEADLYGMWSRGIIDPVRIQEILGEVAPEEAVADWVGMVAKFRTHETRGRRPTKRRP